MSIFRAQELKRGSGQGESSHHDHHQVVKLVCGLEFEARWLTSHEMRSYIGGLSSCPECWFCPPLKFDL